MGCRTTTQRPKLRTLALAGIPWILLVATGLRGIDFGFHWDESYHVKTVLSSLERGVPLPGDYRYPAVSYWIALASALPDTVRLQSVEATPEVRHVRLQGALESRAYRLRTRALFLFLSSLAVLSTYLLVLFWRESATEAFLAASTLGLSWEVAYHARWIAPDAILMQFGALAMLFGVRAALEPRRRLFLVLAAIAAGLACGTKWPAGLLLVPVLGVAWQADGSRRIPRLLAVVGVFAATYLATTPGTLLEFDTLLDSLRMQRTVYGHGHWGHTVAPGLSHLGRVLEYFAFSVGSWHPAISLTLFFLAAVGAWALLRESRRLGLLFLAFPALYLLFFAAYPVMIVRNYLVLIPFFAVLSARGGAVLFERLPRGPLRILAAATLGLLLVWNAAWLIRAGESVRSPDDGHFARALAAHLDANTDVAYAVSPQIQDVLARFAPAERAHVTSAPVTSAPGSDAEELVLYASEGYPHLVGARPRFDLTRAWFGPHEVNFNYYPSWLGRDRIVVIPVDHYPKQRWLPADAPESLRPGVIQ